MKASRPHSKCLPLMRNGTVREMFSICGVAFLITERGLLGCGQVCKARVEKMKRVSFRQGSLTQPNSRCLASTLACKMHLQTWQLTPSPDSGA